MALFFYKEKNKDIRAAAYLRLSIEDGDKAESNSIRILTMDLQEQISSARPLPV